jgi:uncharacterized SAM-binding protein YcdF (DUF218 family)
MTSLVAYLYSVLSVGLSPTTAVLLFLFAAVAWRTRRLGQVCLLLGLAVVLVGGNGWVSAALLRSLERQYPTVSASRMADAIVVLSGGTVPALPPRSTVEVTEAGDRVLYAAELFRRHQAPEIIVTGGITVGIAPRPAADDMAELLEHIGVPPDALFIEREARNTHEHAVNLCPSFARSGIHRVLLVTSALHMRRSLGVFQRTCPAVEYIPAPTDFRAPDPVPVPWYGHAGMLLPTPNDLVDVTDAAHEYVGILYYRARGWL